LARFGDHHNNQICFANFALQRSLWLVLLNRCYSYVFVKTLHIKLLRGDKENQITILTINFVYNESKTLLIINYIPNECDYNQYS